MVRDFGGPPQASPPRAIPRPSLETLFALSLATDTHRSVVPIPRVWFPGCRLTVLLSLAVVGSTACASQPVGVTTETLGHILRARYFASPTAYEAYLRAELAAHAGRFAEALTEINLAEMADPEDGYLPARHAEILLRSGDLRGAEDIARTAVTRHPEASAGWIALAEVLSHDHDSRGAMDAIGHAAALDPDDPDVRAAVVDVAGGTPDAIAAARESSPAPDATDRVASWGAVLAPEGDPRRSTRAHARAVAEGYASTGRWADVDRTLSPWVELDALDLTDRLRVIEARVREGRFHGAARLIAGVPVGDPPGGVPLARHARLWLSAERPELARDEAQRAVTADATDFYATLVLGESLTALGGSDTVAGLNALARIPPGTELYADARVAAAHALTVSQYSSVAEDLLQHAMAGAITAEGRDRLRVERARLLAHGGSLAEAHSALATVETPWGRHRRAEFAGRTDPAGDVLRDLRVRTGVGYEDALADAAVVLVCSQHPGACTPDETVAALGNARLGAPTAVLTARAMEVWATVTPTTLETPPRGVLATGTGTSPTVPTGSLGAGEHLRAP